MSLKDLDGFRSLNHIKQALQAQQSFSAGGQSHVPSLNCSSSAGLGKELPFCQAGEITQSS